MKLWLRWNHLIDLFFLYGNAITSELSSFKPDTMNNVKKSY
jgi:hypothetical protein